MALRPNVAVRHVDPGATDTQARSGNEFDVTIGTWGVGSRLPLFAATGLRPSSLEPEDGSLCPKLGRAGGPLRSSPVVYGLTATVNSTACLYS